MAVAATFYLIGVIAALLLNLLVIVVLGSKKSNINVLDILIISLAVSDFLQSGVGYPIEISALINDTRISDTGCKVAGFSVTFFALVSIAHLVGIAIERYIILKYPWKAREWSETPILSLYVIIPSWLYGFLWALLPLLGWSSYQREIGAEHRCSIDLTKTETHSQAYAYSLLVSCFLIPVVVIVVSCVFIQRELQKMKTQVTNLGMRDDMVLLRRKVEKKHSVMAIVLIITFLLAWSPYAVCVFILTIKGAVNPRFLQFAAVFAKTSTLYNPIIYSILMKEFRVRIKQMLGIRSNRVFPTDGSVKPLTLTSSDGNSKPTTSSDVNSKLTTSSAGSSKLTKSNDEDTVKLVPLSDNK